MGTDLLKKDTDMQTVLTAIETSETNAATSETNASTSETNASADADRAEKAANQAENAGYGLQGVAVIDGTGRWVWAEAGITTDASSTTGASNAWDSSGDWGGVVAADGTFDREIALSSTVLSGIEAVSVVIESPFNSTDDFAFASGTALQLFDSSDNLLRSVPAKFYTLGTHDMMVATMLRMDLTQGTLAVAPDSLNLHIVVTHVSGLPTFAPRLYLAQLPVVGKYTDVEETGGYTVYPGHAWQKTTITGSGGVTVTLPDPTVWTWADGFAHPVINNTTGNVTFATTGTLRTETANPITTRGGARTVRLNEDKTEWILTY